MLSPGGPPVTLSDGDRSATNEIQELKWTAATKTLSIVTPVAKADGTVVFTAGAVVASTSTITVEEFMPATAIKGVNLIKPWYVNSDSTLLNYYKIAQKINAKTPERLQLEGNLLKEVEIKGERKLVEFISKTAWDASFFKEISTEELKKVPNKTLLDLLREKIEGFGANFFWSDKCKKGTSRHNFFNYITFYFRVFYHIS